MDLLFLRSAGIDVHRDTAVVTVRIRTEQGREQVETRTFETYLDALVEMRAWLDAKQVEVVGLESTGVYWKPVAEVLRRKPNRWVVWVVNPAQVKKVPGRKTDVSDSQWLSKLVMHGLVTPSFLPSQEIEELRLLTRFRTKVVGNKTRCKNRILKQIEASGLKLATVCSDVLGVSGRAMLKAMLAGDQTPAQMAELAKGQLRTKRAQLARALAGSFTPATALILRQLLSDLERLESQLAELDAEIAKRLQPFHRELELLLTIPGLDEVSSAAVLAEIGPDMAVFEKPERLAAWGGVCPGSYESAGKSKSGRVRQGNKYLRTMLVQCSLAAKNKRDCFWRQKYLQWVRRLGDVKTHLAIAHKMLVAIFYILRDGVPYRAPPAPPPSPAKAKQMIQRCTEQLAALGFEVQLTPLAAAAA